MKISCKIVEIVQVSEKRDKKSSSLRSCFVSSSDNVDRESADVAEKLHLDSESVVSGNAVALLVNVSVYPALRCDVEV